MRKFSIVGLLVVLITMSVQGQNHRFELGIEGGPGLIFLRGSELLRTNTDATIGFAGGISLQYNIKKAISLRTDLTCERKGAAFSGTFTDVYGYNIGTFNGHSNFDYLTMPLLFRVTFGKKIRYFANAGPFVGYLLRAKIVERVTGLSKIVTDYTPYFMRFDAGLTLGAGISIPVKDRLLLTAELRNDLGLTDTYAVARPDASYIATNSTKLLIGIGYKL